MHVLEIKQQERWNEFVRAQGGPVFARWEWGELCEAYGHDCRFLGVEDESGTLLAGLPVVVLRSRLFGDKLVSMPYSEYGGIISTGEHAAEVELWNRATEIAHDRDVDYVLLRGVDTVPDASGIETEHQYVTFELPLTEGTDAVWDGCETRFRNGVRKAEKNDITTRRVTSTAGLREYYDLFLATMRGHGTPPHSFGFFQRMYDWLGTDDTVRLYLAEYDETVVNGALVFVFGDRAYYWSAVSEYEYRDLNGGSLLLWQAIKDAADDGCAVFDLGRTREGSGVYHYKKSLGGSKQTLNDVYYFPDERVTPPDPEDDTYDLPMRLWRKVPLRVTAHLGPFLRKQIP